MLWLYFFAFAWHSGIHLWQRRIDFKTVSHIILRTIHK